MFYRIGLLALFSLPVLIPAISSTSRLVGVSNPILERLGGDAGGNDKRCYDDTPNACPPQNQTSTTGTPCDTLNEKVQVCNFNTLWDQTCYPAVSFSCHWTAQLNQCPGNEYTCKTNIYSPTGKSLQNPVAGGCGDQATCI